MPIQTVGKSRTPWSTCATTDPPRPTRSRFSSRAPTGRTSSPTRPDATHLSLGSGGCSMELAALYRDIVERSPDAMWVYDYEGRTIYANPALRRLFGAGEEEMKCLTVFDSLDDLGKVHFAGHLADLRAGRYNQSDVETQFARADGSVVWVIISESELRGPDGEFIGVLNRLSDYSDRRATLDNLTSARRRLDEARRIARIGSWEWEIDRDQIWGSTGLQALYGLGPGDFPTTYEGFLEIVHEDDR